MLSTPNQAFSKSFYRFLLGETISCLIFYPSLALFVSFSASVSIRSAYSAFSLVITALIFEAS